MMGANKLPPSHNNRNGIVGRVIGGLQKKKNAAILALGIISNSYAENPKTPEFPLESPETSTLVLQTADRISGTMQETDANSSVFVRKPLVVAQAGKQAPVIDLPDLGEKKPTSTKLNYNLTPNGGAVNMIMVGTQIELGVDYSEFSKGVF